MPLHLYYLVIPSTIATNISIVHANHPQTDFLFFLSSRILQRDRGGKDRIYLWVICFIAGTIILSIIIWALCRVSFKNRRVHRLQSSARSSPQMQQPSSSLIERLFIVSTPTTTLSNQPLIEERLLTRMATLDDDWELACLICLEPLRSEPQAAGSCMHWMHKTCLQQWLKKSRKGECPVCRCSV